MGESVLTIFYTADSQASLIERATMDDQIAEIAADLETLSERLGDVSIQLLREAVDKGETKRPAAERTVSQARRAVDKAARILDGRTHSSI